MIKTNRLSFLPFLAVMLICALAGCKGNGGSNGKKTILTPASTGNPYEVLVVADPEDFQKKAYNALFEVLDDDVPGLPQSESQFKVSKVTTDGFYRTLRFCRNIILVKIDPMYSQGKIKFSRDVYSTPQMIMTIQAGSDAQFADFVTKNADQITGFFKTAEMNREIERLKSRHSLVISEKVQKQFGCDIWMPQELTKMKTAKDFFWASTNKGEKDMNFVIYSYPYTDVNTFTEKYCLDKRDSVMKVNIPGPKEGQYMTTTRPPFVKVTDGVVKNEYAQIARGLWEMENYDMGGPFVSISRVDVKNQRVIVVEGFVYAPGDLKKNLMRRLEAALYTLQLPDEIDAEHFNYDIDEVTIEPESLK